MLALICSLINNTYEGSFCKVFKEVLFSNLIQYVPPYMWFKFEGFLKSAGNDILQNFFPFLKFNTFTFFPKKVLFKSFTSPKFSVVFKRNNNFCDFSRYFWRYGYKILTIVCNFNLKVASIFGRKMLTVSHERWDVGLWHR